MTSVIDDIRTGNWDGLTKEQRKGLKKQEPIDNNIRLVSSKKETSNDIPFPTEYDEPNDNSDYTYTTDAEEKNDYDLIQQLVNIGMSEEQAQDSKKLSNLNERVNFANELIKVINKKYDFDIEAVEAKDFELSEPLKDNNLENYLKLSEGLNIKSDVSMTKQVYSNIKSRVIDLINKFCK
jgi:hypothetical protein